MIPALGRSPPSRSTCSSTPRSSAILALAAGRARAAATVLTVFAMFNFSSTERPRRSRAAGAGEDRRGAPSGAGVLASLAVGCPRRPIAPLAQPIVELFGPEAQRRTSRGHPPDRRIGIPRFLAIGGQGFSAASPTCRAARPDRDRDIVNVVLEVLLSTASTGGSKARRGGRRSRRSGIGTAMVALSQRRAGRRPTPLLPLARASLARRAHLRPHSLPDRFFLLPGALRPRSVTPAAAHQITFQLWIFLALVLDSVAIAGQLMSAGSSARAQGDARMERACG